MATINIPVPSVGEFKNMYNASATSLETFKPVGVMNGIRYLVSPIFLPVEGMLAFPSIYYTTTNTIFPFSRADTMLPNADMYHGLSIYSGSKAAVSDFDNLSTVQSLFSNTHSANKLLHIQKLDCKIEADPVNNEFVLTYSCTVLFQAAQSGLAAWWCLYSHGTDYPLFMGDVSDELGNGEVKLENTNIVSGQSYLLTPFSFRFPASIQIS
jgi:hypothetical protein